MDTRIDGCSGSVFSREQVETLLDALGNSNEALEFIREAENIVAILKFSAGFKHPSQKERLDKIINIRRYVDGLVDCLKEIAISQNTECPTEETDYYLLSELSNIITIDNDGVKTVESEQVVAGEAFELTKRLVLFSQRCSNSIDKLTRKVRRGNHSYSDAQRDILLISLDGLYRNIFNKPPTMTGPNDDEGNGASPFYRICDTCRVAMGLKSFNIKNRHRDQMKLLMEEG